ncbi:GlxA family transcriptional regulator [Pseudomonas lalucatii]|uniref:GlxA family transcriptional regulator n=1 Tax=Pseudomonas lalucatii TaxID=1424203 RepID=A0ABS5Q3E0_9PSED|nr:GlxA family transcriptional regulator [Pseudomonas lalucatii]MBS7663276.1 GlxA family transcriptional regulator [Pseudomonas lalucatii]
MKHYAFLVLPEFSNLCLASSVEPLNAANGFTREPAYRVSLVSIDGNAVNSYSGFRAPICASLDQLIGNDAPDLLFVLASYNYQAHCTDEVIRALRRLKPVVKECGGLDAGSYVLAKAGLLSGYNATIHWAEAEVFAECFADIRVSHDRYVIDRNRITSGGSTSALDLMLHLIRRDCGESVAIAVSELLIFDTERPGSTRQREHLPSRMEEKSPRISRAITIMQKHIEKPLSVELIAQLIGISQRQLERDFKELMKTTVAKHYLTLRVEAARRLIRETRLSVTEVALRSGFSSLASLIRVYKQSYACTPSEDRKKCARPVS